MVEVCAVCFKLPLAAKCIETIDVSHCIYMAHVCCVADVVENSGVFLALEC